MSPKVTILLLTYNRFDYAQRTLEALAQHLRYSGPLSLHIADDGSPAGYVSSLLTVWNRSALVSLTTSDSQRSGYGTNYNLALQTVHNWAEYVLVMEDDWELLRELDLDEMLAAMDEDNRIQCIRFGYIGFTQPLRGEILWAGGQHFLLFDPISPERHVFAGHPRLETVGFQRRVGPWAQGLDPGTTEFEAAGRPYAREGVVWPLNIRPQGDLFAHIGTIQARTDQLEEVPA